MLLKLKLIDPEAYKAMHDLVCKSMLEEELWIKVDNGFTNVLHWAGTPQGHNYWIKVYRKLVECSSYHRKITALLDGRTLLSYKNPANSCYYNNVKEKVSILRGTVIEIDIDELSPLDLEEFIIC